MQGGTLGFSVLTYSGIAVIAILILMFRRSSRSCGYAELGGPGATKYLTFYLLIGLWVVYVALSTLQAYEVIRPGF